MSNILDVYRRFPVAFERGEGIYLFDNEGNQYIDCHSGIGASSLGHAHPEIVEAIKSQAEKFIHCSNIYVVQHAEDLADKIASISGGMKSFFGNSGAEAVELGIKAMRAYNQNDEKKAYGKYRIVTMQGSFHGRTIAATSAADKLRISAFEPYLPGFCSIPPNDIDAFKVALSDDVAGVLLEPILGEGGVQILTSEYLHEVQKICTQRDILLCCDCVQCGSGRTGTFFFYEQYGLDPDIVIIAKGMGGGIPIGACLMRDHVAQCMKTASHGSTYGGNPLVTHVAKIVIEKITSEGFLENVQANGEYLRSRLDVISKEHQDKIELIRGIGLMQGVMLHDRFVAREIATHLMKQGLLVAPSSGNTLRFMPPLIISQDEISQVCDIFERFIAQL